MKKFVLRLFLFAIIIFIPLLLVDRQLPFYWGNEGLSTKMYHIEQTDFAYDTYFIGSSRIYRHIVPSLFDSLNTGKTHSFNLGYSATKPPETYHFLNHFLEKVPSNTKYIILELGDIEYLETANRNALRSKYYLDVEHWWLAVVSHWQDRKFMYSFNYTVSYLSRLLHIGMVKSALSYDKTSGSPNILGKHLDGYCRLEDEMVNEDNNNKFMLQFKADTTSLTKRKKQIEKEYEVEYKLLENKANLKKINDLHQKAARQGIQLILVKMPRSTGVLPLYQNLDIDKIDLGGPQKYPQFYTSTNSYDVGHLNGNGAQAFTRELAREFQNKAHSFVQD